MEWKGTSIGHLVTFIIFLVPNMIDSQRKCSLDKLSSLEYESPKDKFYSNILFLLARPLRSNRRCKHCESPSNPFHFWFFRQFPLSNFSSSSSFLTVRSPIKKTYTGSRSDHDLLLSSFVRERTFVFTFAYNRRSISSDLRSFFCLFPFSFPLLSSRSTYRTRDHFGRKEEGMSVVTIVKNSYGLDNAVCDSASE